MCKETQFFPKMIFKSAALASGFFFKLHFYDIMLYDYDIFLLSFIILEKFRAHRHPFNWQLITATTNFPVPSLLSPPHPKFTLVLCPTLWFSPNLVLLFLFSFFAFIASFSHFWVKPCANWLSLLNIITSSSTLSTPKGKMLSLLMTVNIFPWNIQATACLPQHLWMGILVQSMFEPLKILFLGA